MQLALHDLRVLLSRCALFCLRLAWGKSRFLQSHLDHLGERLSAAGRTISPDRLQGISALEVPKSYAEAASAVGFMGFFRKYLPGFSDLVGLFTGSKAFHSALADPKGANRRSKCPLALDPAQLEAWDGLKSGLLEEVVLAPIDHAHPVVIVTDASARGMGASILVGPELRPFAFMSLAFDEAQRNYSVPDREALAGFTAISRYAAALRGASRVLWVTDHANLAHLVRIHRSGFNTVASMRLRRWCDTLFHELHIPGLAIVTTNGASLAAGDALSWPTRPPRPLSRGVAPYQRGWRWRASRRTGQPAPSRRSPTCSTRYGGGWASPRSSHPSPGRAARPLR